jgi:hypothetical protein
MLEWIGYKRYFSFLEIWDVETTNMQSTNDILESKAVSCLGSNVDIPFMTAKPNINYS